MYIPAYITEMFHKQTHPQYLQDVVLLASHLYKGETQR